MSWKNHKNQSLKGGDFEVKGAIYWVACVLSLEDFLGDYGYACAWIWEELNKTEYFVLDVVFPDLDGKN